MASARGLEVSGSLLSSGSSGSALSSGASEGCSLVMGSVLSSGLVSVPQALISARHMAMQRNAAMYFFILFCSLICSKIIPAVCRRGHMTVIREKSSRVVFNIF